MNKWRQGIAVILAMSITPAVAGYIDFEQGFSGQRLYSAELHDSVAPVSLRSIADQLYRRHLPFAGDADPAAAGPQSGAYFGHGTFIGPAPRRFDRAAIDDGSRAFGLGPGSVAARSAILDTEHPKTGFSGDRRYFSSVPEPGSYALFGLGLLGLAWARRHLQ